MSLLGILDSHFQKILCVWDQKPAAKGNNGNFQVGKVTLFVGVQSEMLNFDK